MINNMKISTNNKDVNNSIKIAFKDIDSNIKNLETKVLIAGADYNRPWTRDAAINIYNGFCFIDKQVSYNTLLSVLEKKDNQLYISGQYWDSVIWSLGAYQYYLVTRDNSFLEKAYEAIKNTVILREKYEYTKEYGLFRGPAVYGDGVSAYPREYGYSGNNSSILEYPEYNKSKCYKKGIGIPMHTLSTNCIYLLTYNILAKIALQLSIEEDIKVYNKKKLNLKDAIKKYFIYDNQKLKYIVGKFGDCLRQEGLGIAFTSMMDLIDHKAFENIYISKNGIPCLYPTYERYNINNNYGRHSGTIWPHVQSFFANEALRRNKHDMFNFEFNKLTEFSNRDNQFYEIYHPITGEPYGGLQENWRSENVMECSSCEHQTWSATGYLSLLLYGFAGIKIDTNKVYFSPYLNDIINEINIKNLKIVDMNINLKISGKGKIIKSFKINDKEINQNSIDINLKGNIMICIVMK